MLVKRAPAPPNSACHRRAQTVRGDQDLAAKVAPASVWALDPASAAHPRNPLPKLGAHPLQPPPRQHDEGGPACPVWDQ